MEDPSKFRCGVPVGVGLIHPTILINLVILSLGVPAPATPRDPLGDAGVEAISDSPSTPDHRLPKGDVVLPAAVRDKLRAEHHPERLLVRFRSGRGAGQRQAAHEMARAKRVAKS